MDQPIRILTIRQKIIYGAFTSEGKMSERSIKQLKQDLERHKRCIKAAGDAEGQIEEIEYVLAQATATLFIMLSQRFVSEDETNKPDDWVYEVMGVSEEYAFSKFTMRFQATNDTVQISLYDVDELLLTSNLHLNERVQFSMPTYKDPGKFHIAIYAFKTKAAAEECLAILEKAQDPDVDTGLN